MTLVHFRMYRDAQGYWRWALLATNGRKIADSGEGYVQRHDCRAGIELVKSSSVAPVYEL